MARIQYKILIKSLHVVITTKVILVTVPSFWMEPCQNAEHAKIIVNLERKNLSWLTLVPVTLED